MAQQRVQMYMPPQMLENLDKEAEEKEVSRSEIIRRIVDKHYEQRKLLKLKEKGVNING